jgi:hypothetical protein
MLLHLPGCSEQASAILFCRDLVKGAVKHGAATAVQQQQQNEFY